MDVGIADMKPVEEGLFSVDPPALFGGRCRSCGWTHFPRRWICSFCQRETVGEVLLGVVGTVYSHTTVHASPPGYRGPVPYVLGVVELIGDGVRIETLLTSEVPAGIRVGATARFHLLTFGEGSDAVLTYAYGIRP